jgi:hypothetical protein
VTDIIASLEDWFMEPEYTLEEIEQRLQGIRTRAFCPCGSEVCHIAFNEYAKRGPFMVEYMEWLIGEVKRLRAVRSNVREGTLPELTWDEFDGPDLDVCPGCGGPADNGNDRSLPPSPYYCTKCTAEENAA